MVAVKGGRRRCRSAFRRRAASRRASGRSRTRPWWRAGEGAGAGGWRRRTSGVPSAGAARRLEKVVHRRLGLEISFSGSGGDWARLRLHLRRDGELLRVLLELVQQQGMKREKRQRRICAL